MRTTKKIYGIALALSCCLVATLKAQNIYIANYVYDDSIVGEYAANGSIINASLITGLEYPAAIAISGTNLFVVN